MFFARVIFFCFLSAFGVSSVCARPYFLPYFEVMAVNVTEASGAPASAPQASETAQLPSYTAVTSDDESATVTPSAPTAVVIPDPAQAAANAAIGLLPTTPFLTSIIIGGGGLLLSGGWM
ncbi:hypothetical protein K439DRAFT_1662619 [Ramaria rubella]|nr:hypothetical protein K439DRAFT_1662619 [Ramaria rubella]